MVSQSSVRALFFYPHRGEAHLPVLLTRCEVQRKYPYLKPPEELGVRARLPFPRASFGLNTLLEADPAGLQPSLLLWVTSPGPFLSHIQTQPPGSFTMGVQLGSFGVCHCRLSKGFREARPLFFFFFLNASWLSVSSHKAFLLCTLLQGCIYIACSTVQDTGVHWAVLLTPGTHR